ncbi:MAG: GAF domain-containing protein [Gammaproteobacteria bacterium]|jgi:GAF domain-containing protein|nr:GAF domain-containing protein [Gammaproteobacteria bacterium]
MFHQHRFQLDSLRAKNKNLVARNDGTPTKSLLDFYSRVAPKIMDSERCGIFILDPEHDTVWLKAGTGVGEHDIEVPQEESVVGTVIATGEPMVVYDMDAQDGTHKLSDEQTGFTTRNVLCVPIRSAVRDETIGALELVNKVGGGGFTDEDLELAAEIAERLQLEAESVFLSQETFGFAENLYDRANKTTSRLSGLLLAAVVAIVVLVVAWITVSFIFG